MNQSLLLPYAPALLALAVVIACVLTQSMLTAPLAFLKNQQAPGMPLQGDHRQFSFRVLRTYHNSVENLPAFGLTLILAVILDVQPPLVNWTAAIYAASRVLFWVAYYGGWGRHAGGPRTMSYVAGILCNGILIVACVIAVLAL